METGYWVKKALKVGISGSEILMLRCESDTALEKRVKEIMEKPKKNPVAIHGKVSDDQAGLIGAAQIIYLHMVRVLGDQKQCQINEDSVLRWIGRWEKYQAMTKARRRKNINRCINPRVQEAAAKLEADCIKERAVYNIIKQAQLDHHGDVGS